MIAATIGQVASSLLAHDQQAAVMGVTSRGVFLRLPSGWVIFISTQLTPGPLTINVPSDHEQLHSLAIGHRAFLSPEMIFFPGEDFSISITPAHVWIPPAPPQRVISPTRRRQRLASVLRAVLAKRRKGGWIALLAYLAGDGRAAGMDGSALIARLKNLQGALAAGQVSAIAAALEPFLGCGPGLTPSGDDLILGLLLALNRWGEILPLQIDRRGLNAIIIEQARRKTTTLSANLIECASRGLADQRLMIALDALVTGTPGAAAAVECLLDWGSSSGLDALVGMASAICAFDPAG